MQIPDQVRKCVVFVCYRNEQGIRLAGTAFFVADLVEDVGISFVTLVTAKHVITGIKEKSIDQKVYLRVNLKGDEPAKLVEIDAERWRFHPDDPYLDAAVLPWAPPAEVMDYLPIPTSMIVNAQVIKDEHITIGDEVFLTGLFANHYGQQRNIPIVRVGNIAAMPIEPVQTRVGPTDAYLIEARSIGGLSGSPVFVYVSGIRQKGGSNVFEGTKFYWLGLMQGHWDLPISDLDAIEDAISGLRSVNMGIAIVVPATKVMEVINQEDLAEMREKELDRRRKETLPTPDDTQATDKRRA